MRLFNTEVSTKKKKKKWMSLKRDRFLTIVFEHLDPAVPETSPLYILVTGANTFSF